MNRRDFIKQLALLPVVAVLPALPKAGTTNPFLGYEAMIEQIERGAK